MRYQVYHNVWGEWVILDLETDDYVTWGNGEIATFLTEEQATNYMRKELS
jgi:hypothetical protein